MTPKHLTNPALANRFNDPWFTALWSQLPNPDPVLRKLGRQHDVFDVIRYDAHVMGELRAIRAGLLKFEWRVVPGDDSRKARNAAVFAREVMAEPPDTDTEWTDLLWTIGYAMFTGFAVHEVLWARDGKYLRPTNIIDRATRRFTFDPADNKLRLLTRSNQIKGEEVPSMRFLVTKHMASFDNPFGTAVFSACFWPYIFKHAGFKYFTEFCEKFGVPWVIGKYPAGTDTQRSTELLDALKQLTSSGVGAIPSDSEIEAVGDGKISGGGGAASPQERLIQQCNKELSKALTSQTLASEIDGQGSRAAADTHRGREMSVNQADREMVSQTISRLFRWVTDVNFGADVAAPKFEFYEEGQARKDWAEVIEKAQAVMPIKAKEAYERLGLTMPGPADEVIGGAKTDDPDDTGTQFRRHGDPLRFASDANISAMEKALDTITDNIDNDITQQYAAAIIEPILTAAEKDPNALLGLLAEKYSYMDEEMLQDKLSDVIFVAQTWGRINKPDDV